MTILFEEGDSTIIRQEAQRLACRGGVSILDAMYFEVVPRQGMPYPIPTDEVLREVIPQIAQEFTVGSQWTAVYRVLVDFCGWPDEIMLFCSRMKSLLADCTLPYKIDYQNIQKTLASSSILRKPFAEWKDYRTRPGDRVFPRQLKIAQKLVNLLAEKLKHTMKTAETYDEQ